MKTQTLPMRSPTPFLPYSGSSAGLTEKRVGAYSSLALIGSALLNADFTRSLESTINLAGSVGTHVNNASDPATDTLNLASAAGFNMERDRSLTSSLSFTDFAHATLDGYHPPGGGSGDPDLSKHPVVFDSDTLSGQVVYVSGDGRVDLAKADAKTTMNAVGLSVNAVTATATDYILTEGSVEQSDWTNVAGTTNLVPGALYYLSEVDAGNIKDTPPASGFVVRVGRAITKTKLDIEIAQEVTL